MDILERHKLSFPILNEQASNLGPPFHRVSPTVLGIISLCLIWKILRNSPGTGANKFSQRFRSILRTAPLVCAYLWRLIRNRSPSQAQPVHLLWALMFLKSYTAEAVNRIMCSVMKRPLGSGHGYS